MNPYDAFAWFYDRYWAAEHGAWQMPALERLLFPALPPGAHILDLCCGTGDLAARMVARGYRVTGVDASGEMLRIARFNAPQAAFVQANASEFTLAGPVDAAVCAFDSLNHLLDAASLASTFRCVHAPLKPGAPFVFDINTGSAYGERWNQTAAEVQADHAFFLRGGFDAGGRIGFTKITMFQLVDSLWRRSDVEMRQRPWEPREVEPLLRAAGFEEIHAYAAGEELGMAGHFGTGRVYFRSCAKSSGPNESSS